MAQYRTSLVQVEALKAQLDGAEERSAAVAAAAVVATKKSAAGEALVASLGARLLASQAEAVSLRSQLSDLADQLDSKVTPGGRAQRRVFVR